MDLKKVELTIFSVTQSATKNADMYTLSLEDVEQGRKISVQIGRSEGDAIVMGLEKVPLHRPMTHDLFKNFIQQTNYVPQEVLIHTLDMKDMIFYVKIIFQRETETLTLDARLSDGVALAVRFGISIYIYEKLFQVANPKGELYVSSPTKDSETLTRELTLEELNQKLQAAIAIEDYEEAVKLRDTINSRLNNSPKH